MSFSHLHVHSHYSLLKASPTIPRLVEKALSLKQPALALTDYGNMFGALELYFECMEKGLRPIIGSEVFYVKDRFKKKRDPNDKSRFGLGGAGSLVLLARSNEGYRNLCRLSSMGFQEGFYFVPRVDYQALNNCKADLFALTGAQKSRVFSIYKKKGAAKALEEIQKLKKIFLSKLYLEFLPAGVSEAENYNLFPVGGGKKRKHPFGCGQ